MSFKIESATSPVLDAAGFVGLDAAPLLIGRGAVVCATTGPVTETESSDAATMPASDLAMVFMVHHTPNGTNRRWLIA